MKTAISIPDDVFQSAEDVAKTLKVSRSEFYTRAVKQYVKTQRKKDIQDRLNNFFDKEDNRLDPVMEKLQSLSLGPSDW